MSATANLGRVVPSISSLFPNFVPKVVKTSSSLKIPASIGQAVSSTITTISDFFKSNSLSAKIAKTGLGIAVAGGGVAVGTGIAGNQITETTKDISKGVGLPTELIFIIGAVILLLVLIGGKRRK